MWLSKILISALMVTAAGESIAENSQSPEIVHYGVKISTHAAKLNTAGRDALKNIKNAGTQGKESKPLVTQCKNQSLMNLKDKDMTPLPLTNHDNLASMVGEMAWQILDQNTHKCHNVFMTMDSTLPVAQEILKKVYMSTKGLLVVDLQVLKNTNMKDLVENLWGSDITTCHTLLIDFTGGFDTHLFSILETSRFWVWYNARVVIVGKHQYVGTVLLQQAFRNVPLPIYLALEDETLNRIIDPSFHSETDVKNDVAFRKVKVYGRCLYCGNGSPEVKVLALWTLGSDVPLDFDPFPNQTKNLHGRVLKAASMRLFPYIDFTEDTDEVAPTLTLTDSLDKRMLDAFTVKMNFSVEARLTFDVQWGIIAPNGTWSGVIGAIQREIADFTTIIALNRGRNKIVDFVRAYLEDVMAIVSLKPQALPRYFVIVRPFTADVWLYMVLIVIIWGISLWFFQKMWSYFSEGEAMTLSDGLFYSWAVILEDPPKRYPTNLTGQMLVGLWLMACLIITTGFKSSLIAHLTVESQTPPIDSLEDLVQQKNWRWAMHIKMFTASPVYYLRTTKNPMMMKISKHLESAENAAEGLGKVRAGGFSYMQFENGIRTEIDSYHTDDAGRTPFHVSKRGAKLLSDFGWGLRKGAPFGNQFKYYANRLIDTGLIDHWTETLMKSRIAKNRRAVREGQNNNGQERELQNRMAEEDNSKTLGMSHVMGIFLMLLLGFCLSLMVFGGEMMVKKVAVEENREWVTPELADDEATSGTANDIWVSSEPL